MLEIKMLVLFMWALTGVWGTTFTEEAQQIWTNFKLEHKKEYNSTEEIFRMMFFHENLRMIQEHNDKYEKGEKSYKMGPNKYSDMLYSEFEKVMLPPLPPRKFKGDKFETDPNAEVPNEMDWGKKGAVSEVKDQGQCGACWAFSTTGSLEGFDFVKTKKLTSLSEQNLLDCSSSSEYGNEGCNGGTMDASFTYIKDNGGIDTETSYPYSARQGQCKYNAKNSAGTDSGFVDLPETEEALKEVVGTKGPVSIGLHAARSLQNYQGGIYEGEGCNPKRLNHAIIVTGYGTENGKDYWIVKNSWGPGWGEKGYARFARGEGGICGITAAASYPKV